MKRFVTCLLLFMSIFTIGCSMVDKKITKQMEAFHEEDMKAALVAFQEYMDNTESFYTMSEQGIKTIEEFSNHINTIENLHNEYHNTEILPRDSEEWATWMTYERERDFNKSQTHLTVCPFCLAEERNKTKEKITWLDTSLFTYNVDKRINNILTLLKDEQMKVPLQEMKEYLATQKAFSKTEKSNWITSKQFKGYNFYALLTPEYKTIREKMGKLHAENHLFSSFDEHITNTIFYYKDAVQKKYLDTTKPITCCPICIVIDDKIRDGSFTKDMESISWTYSEEYMWEVGNFAQNLLAAYSVEEGKKLHAVAEKKQLEEMPIMTMDDIYTYFRKGESYAKSELRGKRVKIKASVVMTDGKKAFIGDMYPVILPQKDYNQLYGRDFPEITFIGTIFINDQIMEGAIGFRDCQVLNIKDLW